MGAEVTLAEHILHAFSVVEFVSPDSPRVSWFGEGYTNDEFDLPVPSACILRCCEHPRCNRRDAIASFTAWYKDNLRR